MKSVKNTLFKTHSKTSSFNTHYLLVGNHAGLTILLYEYTIFFLDSTRWHRVRWHWWHWPITMSQCFHNFTSDIVIDQCRQCHPTLCHPSAIFFFRHPVNYLILSALVFTFSSRVNVSVTYFSFFFFQKRLLHSFSIRYL